jgi:extradiol dioxygenase family protein
MSLMPFHISVPVSDLASARKFYGELLGCSEGRSTGERIDFNFFGHHLVTHVEPKDAAHETTTIMSSGVPTPVRHFGVVLPHDEWERIAERLKAAKANFFLEPQTLFAGEVNEQAILLASDNCGNVVELKAEPRHGLFAKEKQ